MALGQASSCLSSGFRWWRCLGLGRVHKTRHSLVYDVKHGRCHVSVELLAMDAPGWRQLGPLFLQNFNALCEHALHPRDLGQKSEQRSGSKGLAGEVAASASTTEAVFSTSATTPDCNPAPTAMDA
eukprot:CAMPEP_0182919456 /NCGR_PEP_ID=MMETSP0105_2-20130417/2737_1 /TAXON_ID=81532 ORGANISM="Acanthoeca-like sp., Strain 10tr" /NCGR_SAMPLE_ID=MMETSP0105_2 /ASSEMBLY_ACC=CAM_ASM_000205 /LENGTH=125 /DNA_ID=CAMNT_0025056647 /DNA_START=420 /DNA_END=794 /DNA_ORIENTATION=+